MSYLSKSDLYGEIAALLKALRLSYADYPLDFLSLCGALPKTAVEFRHFHTRGLCGLAFIGEQTDTIVLNTRRSPPEQNFDCAHEFIHTRLHRTKNLSVFSCHERISANQNRFLEWQANEGAAQLLVPHQLFIPRYLALSKEYAKAPFPFHILAGEFRVSPGVVATRMKSLNCEIYQYMRGARLSGVRVLSENAQKSMGWDKSHKKTYCKNCLSPVAGADRWCGVCGGPVRDGGTPERGKYTNTGAGFMIYRGISVDSRGKAMLCPVCGNEEISPEGDYCPICGTILVNRCAPTEKPAEGGGVRVVPPCKHADKILPGNARYCPRCGNETTFFQNKFLPDWVEEPEDPAFF